MRIELEALSRSFRNGDSITEALKGLDFTFPETGLVCILGPSGSGKSTLLNLLGGLDKPTSGRLLVDGEDVSSFTPAQMDSYRNRKVGLIFQEYYLMPGLTAEQNIALALDIRRADRSERDRAVRAAMRAVGIEEVYGKKIGELSGGQKQRVAIARAIVTDPGVILADEPTGALDSANGREILSLLRGESRQRLVIVVTHNEELALEFADLIVRMRDGEIVDTSENRATGPAAEIDFTVGADSNKKLGLGFVGSMKLGLSHIKTRFGRFITVALATAFGVMFVAFTLCISAGFGTYVTGVNTQTGSSMAYVIPSYITRTVSDSWEDYNQTQEYPDTDEVYPYYTPSSSYSYQYNGINSHYIQFLDQLIDDGILSDYIVNYAGDGGLRVLTEQPGTILTGEGGGALEVNTETYASMAPDTGGMSYEPTSIFHPLFGTYEDDYDVLEGRLPESEDELVLIVDQRNAVSFNTLRALGFYNEDDTQEDVLNPSLTTNVEGFSFDNVIGKEYKIYSLDDYYTEVDTSQIQDGDGNDVTISKFTSSYLLEDGVTDQDKLDSFYEDTEPTVTATIVGIIRPSEGLISPSMRTGIGYLSSLSTDMMAINERSDVAQAFQDSLVLQTSVSDLVSDLEDLLSSGDELTNTALEELCEDNLVGYAPVTDYYASNPSSLYHYTSVAGFFSEASDYAADLNDETLAGLSLNDTDTISSYLDEMGSYYASGDIDTAYYMVRALAAVAYSYSQIDSITLIPSSLDTATTLLSYLDDYNNVEVGSVYHAQSDSETVYYYGSSSWMVETVGQAVSMSSVILVIFAVISLIAAAAICIAVTNMSVAERTREIGILRAEGARSRDVGFAFEAEAFIAGVAGALIGSLLAYIFTFPVNAIVNAYYPEYSIGNIATMLWWHPLAVLPIAIVVTMVAAIIPSLKAARKDPVKCLRHDE